jgi:hypothetical protein
VNLLEQLSTLYFKGVSFPWVTLYEVLLFCITTVFFIDLISVVIFLVVAEDSFIVCWVAGLLTVMVLLRFTNKCNSCKNVSCAASYC